MGDLLAPAVVGAGHRAQGLLAYVVDLFEHHLVLDAVAAEHDVGNGGVGQGAEILGRALGDRVAVYAYMTEVHAVRPLGPLQDAGLQRPAGRADGVDDGRSPLHGHGRRGPTLLRLGPLLVPCPLDHAAHRGVPGGLLERGERRQGGGGPGHGAATGTVTAFFTESTTKNTWALICVISLPSAFLTSNSAG